MSETIEQKSTELDSWKPEGIPIHPYDVYDLIAGGGISVELVNKSPSCIDEADYLRNRNKIGTVIEINGNRYFETTSMPFKSTTFKEEPCQKQ